MRSRIIRYIWSIRVHKSTRHGIGYDTHMIVPVWYMHDTWHMIQVRMIHGWYPSTSHSLVDPPPLFGSNQFGWFRFGSVRLGSVRPGSIRFGSIRFDSIRLDSVRFDWVRFGSRFSRLDLRFDSIRFDWSTAHTCPPLSPPFVRILFSHKNTSALFCFALEDVAPRVQDVLHTGTEGRESAGRRLGGWDDYRCYCCCCCLVRFGGYWRLLLCESVTCCRDTFTAEHSGRCAQKYRERRIHSPLPYDLLVHWC